LQAEHARTFRDIVGIRAIRPDASVKTDGTGARGREFGIGGEVDRRFLPNVGGISQAGGEPLIDDVVDPFASSYERFIVLAAVVVEEEEEVVVVVVEVGW